MTAAGITGLHLFSSNDAARLTALLAREKSARQVSPNPVIIRTMDLGGDKFFSPIQLPSEMNPFMGWRAIRFSLARPDSRVDDQ